MELSARILENAWVRLEPLEERHRAEMVAAAEADATIFRHMPYPVETQGFAPSFAWLLNERAEGRWIPHVVIAKHPPPLAGEVASEASGRRLARTSLRDLPLPQPSPASGGGSAPPAWAQRRSSSVSL